MLNFKFIGWCNEDGHDKVWGAIKLRDDKCVTFWGRRGKKLQTKIVDDGYGLDVLIEQKIYKKGYVEVNPARLSSVYPEFESDLSKTAVWAMFKV